MSGIFSLGKNFIRNSYHLPRTFSRSHSISVLDSRVQVSTNEHFSIMSKQLDFEEFKKTQVKSFELYKQSPAVKQLYGDDINKITKSYEEYCTLKYNRYLKVQYGGNPATMI